MVLILWAIGAGLFIMLATGLIPAATEQSSQVIAQSPPTIALPATPTIVWPATWTPPPTPTKTVQNTPLLYLTPPAESCYVETAADMGNMRYALDCELTALWYLLQTHPRYQDRVARDALYSSIVYHENPNKGFRGDMRGPRPGNSDLNYGMHARALADAGQRIGVPMQVIRSVYEMKQHLCRGEPVIAWMRSAQGRGRHLLVQSYQDAEGAPYYTVAYEHAVLVTGYDGEKIWYRDPSNGRLFTMGWRLFENEILLFDKQMTAIRK